MAKGKTGWEIERRAHFDEIVVNYDKARWNYPDELFSDIFTYAGKEADKKAIEIGAGTGKATTPFLDAGYDVTAVEMGENMTEFLRNKYKAYPNFNVITNTFENAVLKDNSFDLIYAASSFHWIDAEIGCPKAHGLLKNNGVFVLFRNNAVPAGDDELYAESQGVYEKHYYSYYKTEKRPVSPSEITYEDFLKPTGIYRAFRFNGLEQYGFKDIKIKLYNVEKIYTADEYIALLDTYSDHRALPDDNRASLYEGIKNAIIKHGGYQKLNCIFQLYMGHKWIT